MKDAIAVSQQEVSPNADVTVIGRIIEVLNRAIAVDRKAMETLMSIHVPCSEELVKDPTIQTERDLNGAPRLSMRGLLSGLAGAHYDGSPKIVLVYKREDACERPTKLLCVEAT